MTISIIEAKVKLLKDLEKNFDRKFSICDSTLYCDNAVVPIRLTEVLEEIMFGWEYDKVLKFTLIPMIKMMINR